MNDEKISLRIEGEELARIDSYLDGHPEAGSRSLFNKNCIREKLDRDARPIAETAKTGSNTITLTLPGRYMAALERMVADEYATSIDDAAIALLRDSMRQILDDARSAGADGAKRAYGGE